MELRQLKYFVKAAETLNFSEAAKALYVTQSTLSQQVRQLEDEIGIQLFERSSHNVILTTLHVGKDSAQVHQYGYKTHVGQLAIVLHPRTAHCRHQVTAQKTEFSLRVFLLQSRHQVRRMKVARGFTNDQIVLHK